MQCYFIFDYSVSIPGHLQTWKNLNISTNKYIEQTYFKQGPQVQPAPGTNPSYGPGSSDRSVNSMLTSSGQHN